MKFTFRVVFIIFVVLATAFVIRRMIQMISTDVDDARLNNKNVHRQQPLKDTTEDLIWFVQISDLHLSVFYDPHRIVEFRQFCESTVPIIQPRVVLATGDLTDARAEERVGSKQMIEEWSIYSDVLNKSGVLSKTTWLDVRGNHDNFNVPGVRSPMNLFRRFSVQGPKHLKSYIHVERTGGRNYSFIAVDSCADQGLKRPLNFIGYVSPEELTHLERLDKTASMASDYAIWFGHYPTSAIVNGPTIRQLIGSGDKSLAYLCGHYHSLLSVVPQMYTLQKQHYLELELEDWKVNRMFRVAAIDHGLLSFVDVKHDEWPIILVLQPKNALHRLRLKEPLFLTDFSFVRILVFSKDEIISVKIKLDKGKWQKCAAHPHNRNLYRASWNPKQYESGPHIVYVKAVDRMSRERVISQPFSFDDSKFDFHVLPRIVLMTNLSFVFKNLFWTTALFSILPLWILRCLENYKPTYLYALIRNRWIRKIWVISYDRHLLYGFVFYPLYLGFGPWAVGELIDGHFGLMFIWGTYINNQFVPELSTYGYGFFQLAFLHFPLIIATACALDRKRSKLHVSSESLLSKIVDFLLFNVPFVILLAAQLWMSYAFWWYFGLTALSVGPMRTLPTLLVIMSWYYVRAPTNMKTSNPLLKNAGETQ